MQPQLLVDTNLLVLYLVGVVNEDRIPVFKRTRQYSKQDFAFLAEMLARVHSIYTVAHVMAEVSNLTDLGGSELTDLRTLLKERLSVFLEPPMPSASAAQDEAFLALGLTDASIAKVAEANGCPVLTDDLTLFLVLERRGIPALNFTHLRRQAGILP